MKESKLYLQFFKKNSPYFFIASVTFSVIGLLYQLHSPTYFKYSRLLEIGQDSMTVTEKTSLVDEAVTLARSENIQKQYNILSDIAIFNNSPLSVVVQSTSINGKQSAEDLNKISSLLSSKFNFTEIGSDSYVQESPNLYLGIIAGFLIGNFLVTVLLLALAYMKKY